MTTTTSREQQPGHRVAGLEATLACLVRSVYDAVERLGGNAGFSVNGGNGWLTWKQPGADHQAITGLHAFLQRHPEPHQD
jgi:hypothetical protein